MDYGSIVKCDMVSVDMINWLIEHVTNKWQLEFDNQKYTFIFESYYDALNFKISWIELVKKP